MIAPEYFNNHIAVEGEIIVKRVPNDTGSVMVWNPTTKKISIRTHSEIISDLSLMTTNTDQMITGKKAFVTSGGNYAPFNNTLQIYADDGSLPSMTYSKGGSHVGQIMFNSDGFYFKNGDDNAYYNVKSKGFIKENGDNSKVLLDGGEAKNLSEFAMSSDLSHVVTTNTEQTIIADKVFKKITTSDWVIPKYLAFPDASGALSNYIGFYMWNSQWQVNWRDSANNYSYPLLDIDGTSRNATFYGNTVSPRFTTPGGNSEQWNQAYNSIGNNVTLNTDQSISGKKQFDTGFSSYDPDGLFSLNSKPLGTITPGGNKILLGYKDYGGGQYFPRIGFLNKPELIDWSAGPIGKNFVIGIDNDGLETFKIHPSGATSKTQNSTQIFEKTYQGYYDVGGHTGILAIKMPQASPDEAMFSIDINIYGYESQYLGKLNVAFYKYVSGTMIGNGSKALFDVTDNFPTLSARVGIGTDGYVSILLGDPSTFWNGYFSFEIAKVEVKYGNFTQDWSQGWSHALESSFDQYGSNIILLPTDVSATRNWVNNNDNFVKSQISNGSYNANQLDKNSITYGYNVANAPASASTHSFSILNLDTADQNFKMQLGFDMDTNEMFSRIKFAGNYGNWEKYWTTQNFNPNNFIPTSHPAYGVTSNEINDWRHFVGYWDNRHVQPAHILPQKFQIGFTNWFNNGDQASHYADYLHFGGYQDSSGGSQNLIMFSKSGPGIRQWQGSPQGVADYQSYVDYWHTGNLTQTEVNSWNNIVANSNNFVTLHTEQTIISKKVFAGGDGNDYTGAPLMINGNGASNTVFPTIAFHQPTLYAGTLQYRGDGFYFMNITGDGFDNVKANAYFKVGSDDNYILLGGGGHKAVSHFATSAILNDYLKKDGGTMTGMINFANNAGGLSGTMGDNDFWRVVGRSNGSDNGYLEIATADGGIEPIHISQYSGSFTNLVKRATILDENGNTSFPGYVSSRGYEMWTKENWNGKVGARNLVPNASGIVQGGNDYGGSDNSNPGYLIITSEGNWNSYAFHNLVPGFNKSGKTLTAQIEVMHDNPTDLTISAGFYVDYASTLINPTTVVPPNTWVKLVGTVKNVTASGSQLVGLSGAGANVGTKIYYRNYQLEESMIPSSYRPAYEDFVLASQLGSYITQTSLNSQLANYATLNGVQTFTQTNTFNQNIIVPNATLGGHAVNANVLNANDRNYITDTRGTERPPSFYDDRYAQWDFQNHNDTLAGGDAWHGVLTVSKWDNFNIAHKQEQLFFTGDDLKRRTATSDDTWGSVKTIWDSGNLPDYRLHGLGTTTATVGTSVLDLNNVTHTSIYDINDNSTNKPFDYGSVWTHRKTGSEFTQYAVDVLNGSSYTRGWSSSFGDTGWKKNWNTSDFTYSDLANWSEKFKTLRFTSGSDLESVTESGIYRQEGSTSGYNYTTTLNLNSFDGRQQLTIERTGGGMKFRGSYSASGNTGWSDWKDVIHSGNITSYINNYGFVTQSSLSTQISSYATLAGVQTFQNTNTFSQSPIIPNGTLGSHAVNLNQLNNKVTNEDSVRGVAFDSGSSSGVPYFIHVSGTYVPIATQSWVSTNFANQSLSVGSESNGGQSLTLSNGNTVTITNNFVSSRDGSRMPNDIKPNENPHRVRFDFANANQVGGSGNYAGVMTYSPWDGTSASTGDSSYQLAFANQSGVNGAGVPMLKIRKGIDGNWSRSWYKFWTDADFNNTNIQQWNYAYQFGLKLNEEFTTNSNAGLMVADNYFGGESGMVDIQQQAFVAGKTDEYYKYGSGIYGGLEGVNYHLKSKNVGIGGEADPVNKVRVEGCVKATENFKSKQEQADTLFIPNGNLATLRDEIVNDESDYAIRLDPHEYEFDPSGYLEVDDRNRLIHIIGEQTKMVVNFREIYPKQQIVIYNFDKSGGSMAVQVYGKTIYNIESGFFLRLYITKSRRVIAERQQPNDFIW